MANIKPIELNNSHISKTEKKARLEAEKKLKGDKSISILPPPQLSEGGGKIYQDIINTMPKDFLTGIDAYIVGVVAESLDRMKECQEKINSHGLFNDDEENVAVKTYEKYSKIFNTYSSKLGMSPKDRAALSCLILNDKKEDDPLLKALSDDDD